MKVLYSLIQAKEIQQLKDKLHRSKKQIKGLKADNLKLHQDNGGPFKAMSEEDIQDKSMGAG